MRLQKIDCDANYTKMKLELKYIKLVVSFFYKKKINFLMDFYENNKFWV